MKNSRYAMDTFIDWKDTAYHSRHGIESSRALEKGTYTMSDLEKLMKEKKSLISYDSWVVCLSV
jgi:hypothetical protein